MLDHTPDNFLKRSHPLMAPATTIGIDIGSTALSLAQIDLSGNLMKADYDFHHAD